MDAKAALLVAPLLLVSSVAGAPPQPCGDEVVFDLARATEERNDIVSGGQLVAGRAGSYKGQSFDVITTGVDRTEPGSLDFAEVDTTPGKLDFEVDPQEWVKFRLSFVRSGTTDALEVPGFSITLFDVDASSSTGTTEYACVHKWESKRVSYTRFQPTALRVVPVTEATTGVAADVCSAGDLFVGSNGEALDGSPSDLNKLSNQQKKAAIVLSFGKPTSSFDITYGSYCLSAPCSSSQDRQLSLGGYTKGTRSSRPARRRRGRSAGRRASLRCAHACAPWHAAAHAHHPRAHTPTHPASPASVLCAVRGAPLTLPPPSRPSPASFFPPDAAAATCQAVRTLFRRGAQRGRALADDEEAEAIAGPDVPKFAAAVAVFGAFAALFAALVTTAGRVPRRHVAVVATSC